MKSKVSFSYCSASSLQSLMAYSQHCGQDARKKIETTAENTINERTDLLNQQQLNSFHLSSYKHQLSETVKFTKNVWPGSKTCHPGELLRYTTISVTHSFQNLDTFNARFSNTITKHKSRSNFQKIRSLPNSFNLWRPFICSYCSFVVYANRANEVEHVNKIDPPTKRTLIAVLGCLL